MPNLRPFLGLLLRYGVVGVINTMLGGAVVFALDRSGAATPGVANALGLMLGLLVSFTLHRRIFTAEQTASENIRYAIAVAIAFVADQIVLHVGLAIAGASPPSNMRLACQISGVGTYSMSLFLLSRFWVFAGTAHVTRYASRQSSLMRQGSNLPNIEAGDRHHCQPRSAGP